ncbi:MAG: hypothetical protein ACAI35_27290 [Candidatus Methylacidiphilales bacterium]|nr:hypothetical protein [Candidatus Methylacidiphilales bacterium]
MALRIPTSKDVAYVLKNLDQPGYINEDKIREALYQPRLATGLNHWELWLLVCLYRHTCIRRWAGHIIKKHLRKYRRHKSNDSVAEGPVPDSPHWRFRFQRSLCVLTNADTGAELNIYNLKKLRYNCIYSKDYIQHLNSLRTPEEPELLFKRPAALEEFWIPDLKQLEKAGYWLAKESTLTSQGEHLAEVLRPVIEQICCIQEWNSQEEAMQAIYLLLHCGDTTIAGTRAWSSVLSPRLIKEIKSQALNVVKERASALTLMLKISSGWMSRLLLQSLADLGPEYAKTEVTQRLFDGPDSGNSHQALAILDLWQPSDFDAILEKALVLYAPKNQSRSLFDVLLFRKKDSSWLYDGFTNHTHKQFFLNIAHIWLRRNPDNAKPHIRKLLARFPCCQALMNSP